VANCNYKRKTPRKVLEKMCKRAAPKMWGAYSTYSITIKIIRDGYPKYINSQLKTTLYTERRNPLMGKFYDNSRGKIGKHHIESRLNDLKDFEWLGLTLSNDAITTRLKSYLNFGYE